MKNLLFLLLIALCIVCGKQERIVIASKNFTEQVILGELLAQQIERKTGLHVDRKLNLGGTFICHKAIVAGEVDAYVEYTGTALTAILKRDPIMDSAVVYKEVQDAYQKMFHLRWTEPLGFNNTFAMIIRAADARKNGIRTISDAVPYAPHWIAGFGYEFIERKDGFPGLAATYGLKFSEPPKVMDLTLTYKAVAARQVDFIAGNSTDGLISKLDLVVLQDNKHYFPPYDAAPVVREAILQKYPKIADALKELGGTISEETMRKMNYSVDGEHRDVKAVVADFLRTHGSK